MIDEVVKTGLAAKSLSLLEERIYTVDPVQCKRFGKLSGKSLEIAVAGIIRHLRSCEKMDVMPDSGAIREIIDDAKNEQAYFTFDVPSYKKAA